MTEPMGDTLEPKILEYHYENAGKPHCHPECEHLSVTERQQDVIFASTGKKPPHFCRRYQQAVMHGKKHPMLKRLRECEYGDDRQGGKEN